MLTYDTRDGQNYEYRLTRCQVSCIQILSDGKLREQLQSLAVIHEYSKMRSRFQRTNAYYPYLTMV